LNTPLALMFISCTYNETLDQRLALPKGPNRKGCWHYSLIPHSKQNKLLKCHGFKILTQWAVFKILVKKVTYLAQLQTHKNGLAGLGYRNKCHVGVWESKVTIRFGQLKNWGNCTKCSVWWQILKGVQAAWTVIRMHETKVAKRHKKAGKWSERGKRHKQRWLDIYSKEGWGSLRNMEKKCKNLLSDKDLCTEHDGRVWKKMVK
jgi:hypothetical protein